MTFTIFALPIVQLQSSFQCPLRLPTCMGLWIGGFSTDLRSQIGKSQEKFGGAANCRPIARPTNNTEQLCGQRKGGKFKCEHFKKIFPGFHEIFGLHRTNLASFVVCFNVVQLILFYKKSKHLVCVKIFYETKLQAFVKMQITRNQPKSSQNRRIFRELNNIGHSSWPVHCELNHYTFCWQ